MVRILRFWRAIFVFVALIFLSQTAEGYSARVLAKALFLVASGLPAPHTAPEQAEAAQAQRTEFLGNLAEGLADAAEEATCSGELWSQAEDCKKAWSGTPAELAALALTLGWFESKLDPEIQAGRCDVWGTKPSQITCDGVFLGSGVRSQHQRGILHHSRWGWVLFRSVTVFQLHELSDDRQREVVGLGEVNVFESCRSAVKIIAGAQYNCRPGAWACVISSYAGSIEFRQAPMRVQMFRKVLAKVQEEMRVTKES